MHFEEEIEIENVIRIEVLLLVLAIPEIKVYSWCRCKLVVDERSESHFHWHDLVHFPTRKL